MLREKLGGVGGGDVNVPSSTLMLRRMLGWVGLDVNIPCTCTHVGCYATCLGGMITFLALAHMLDATQLVRGGGMTRFFFISKEI